MMNKETDMTKEKRTFAWDTPTRIDFDAPGGTKMFAIAGIESDGPTEEVEVVWDSSVKGFLEV